MRELRNVLAVFVGSVLEKTTNVTVCDRLHGRDSEGECSQSANDLIRAQVLAGKLL